MLCLSSDLVPVNPPTLHDEHYLHTVFIEPFGVCLCAQAGVNMNVIFVCVCVCDCRVNAVCPCHIEAGGLIAQCEDKKDPFLNPCLQQTPVFCGFAAIVEAYDTDSLIP